MNKMAIPKQSWKKFEEIAISKKVFLFGLGNCANILFERYSEKIELCGIVDSNSKKQSYVVGDFLAEAWGTKYENLVISDLSLLRKYATDDIAIVIASKNHAEEIKQQLLDMGFNNLFSVIEMEQGENVGIPTNTYMATYANECNAYVINNKKIIFYSFGTYSDHGKYITEKLLKIRNDLDIVWVINALTTEVPEGVRKIYIGNWKKYIFEMQTAKIWVYNMVIPEYITKRLEQIYIQTKHWASITLKKFYLNSLTLQGNNENTMNWIKNGRMMDYIFTGSEFDSQSCQSGFGLEGEVIQIGSARSDALFMEEKYKNIVHNYYHLDRNIHILLFAPTYRFKTQKGNYAHEFRNVELDYEKIKIALEKHFGGTWYILLRLHPSVAKESKDMVKPYYVIDACEYEDSQELVAACDVMISDYSSIMFEMSFVKKPVFLFATDIQEYINHEYDLLIDYEALPFPMAETNDELVKNIEEFSQKKYTSAVDRFLNRYGVCEDGHASERAAEFISKLINC